MYLSLYGYIVGFAWILQTLDVKGKWKLEVNTIIEDEDWERSWMSWHKMLK